ncbi:AAA family ATPase [Paeniroseomonas aquatica]|uniref:AAA family ATPase n=1 Tax=Paeniroseomonas aquatica TaxID=373043 RepID=UPI00361DD3E0
MVAAWQAQGRAVHGVSLAWRQADDLAEAGIDRGNVRAFSVFLDAAKAGGIALDRRAVVVVDELGLLGTRQGWSCCGCSRRGASGWRCWATTGSARRSRPGRSST